MFGRIQTKCSIETALTRINNDIMTSLDTRKLLFLVLLDLSAAFDTVDHAVLLSQLRHDYFIKDSAHAWFSSYLSNRSQSVHFGGQISNSKSIIYGVAARLCFGTCIIFTLY